MLFKAGSPVDRYAAAHEHFSSGFDFKKIVLVLVLIGVVAFFVYYAVKKND